MKRVRQAIILVILATILATGANLISSNRIPYKGDWPSISGSDSILVPPSAQPGDPPFLSLDEAAVKFQSRNVIFIDARDTADYSLGRIRGSVNLPYEQMDAYWDRVIPNIPTDKEVVIYCSGGECELSLMLGREMNARGFKKVYVFFGGWREWELAKLPVEGVK